MQHWQYCHFLSFLCLNLSDCLVYVCDFGLSTKLLMRILSIIFPWMYGLLWFMIKETITVRYMSFLCFWLFTKNSIIHKHCLWVIPRINSDCSWHITPPPTTCRHGIRMELCEPIVLVFLDVSQARVVGCVHWQRTDNGVITRYILITINVFLQ